MTRFSRLLSLGVLWALLLCNPLPALAAGGITDGQVSPAASIAGYKIKGFFASEAAFEAAWLAECQKTGTKYPGLTEGVMFYDTTTDEIKIYSGAAWVPYAPGAGAGLGLDDAYTNGQDIVRDLAAVKIADANGDALNSFWIARTNGTGPAINIDNAGTGPDIQGDLWSVDTSGQAVLTRLDLADSQPIRFGSLQDVTLMWNATDLIFTPAAANSQIDLGGNGTGMDLLLNTGTAGDFIRFDASDKMLYSVDANVKMGDLDPLMFGTATGAANVDGDFAIYYDGSDLLINATAAGDGIIFGPAGSGPDVTFLGIDPAASALFDSNASGDRLFMTGYAVQMADAAVMGFGSGAGGAAFLGDIQLSYAGGGNLLSVINSTGAAAIAWGVNGEGPDQTWYGDTAANSLLLDATNDQLLGTSFNVHMDDDSILVAGTGAGAGAVLGDMQLQYLAGTDVLQLSQTVAGAGADGTGALAFGPDGEGFDVIFRGETAGDEMRWDNDLDGVGAGALAGLTFSNGTVLNGDAGFSVTIGASNVAVPVDGMQITGAAAAMGINGVAAGGDVIIGAVQDTNFTLWGANGAGADQVEVSWDYGADTLTIDQADVILRDGDMLEFGDAADIDLVWETVAGVPAADALHIEPVVAADVPVVFGSDGSANNVDVYLLSATAGDYMWWDNDNITLASVDALISLGDGTAADDAILFGAATDIRIFWRDAGA
ncbi:MAG: hypothetical protein ABH877_04560, partial [bacterium]